MHEGVRCHGVMVRGASGSGECRGRASPALPTIQGMHGNFDGTEVVGTTIVRCGSWVGASTWFVAEHSLHSDGLAAAATDARERYAHTPTKVRVGVVALIGS